MVTACQQLRSAPVGDPIRAASSNSSNCAASSRSATTSWPRPERPTAYGRPDGSKNDVAVAVTLDTTIDSIDGLELVDLPAEPQAASVTHRGPASEIADAWQTMDVALEQRGLESYGVHRQLQLDSDDPHNVVVELQYPVREAGTACT